MRRLRKSVILVLLFLFLLLGAGVGYLFVNRDKEPPVFRYDQEAVILTEQEKEELAEGNTDILLNGVYAEDEADGDLTDKIFVHAVDVKTENLYAIVTYRVMDTAGNTAVGKRIVYLKTPEEIHELLLKKLYGVPDENEDVPLEEKPVLLLQKEITIQAGGVFNPEDYVLEVHDNKDSVEYLAQHATVIGSYDLNTPGTYTIGFYVTDSDGNISDPAMVTLIVK